MIKKVQVSPLKIVGIGASAGGLEPLQQVISRIPHKLPHIAIIIAQHLSPDYKSMLVELIARKTKLAVKHVENDMRIDENTIYIVPATADAIIKDSKFKLIKSSDLGAHPSIDVLFNSIAREFGSNSCGIILSGTGKDGSQGIINIKKKGGLVIVQEPETSRYDGMPHSAIHTGIVDQVLPPDSIGDDFLTLITQENKKIEIIEDEISEDESDYSMKTILDLLERRIGIDFSDYKISTMTRRLEKRLQDKKFKNEDEYLEYIRRTPEELDRLFESILIGVTSFFRDRESFKHIEKIVERIVKAKKPGEAIRVWVPGCATGEEAYTYAIIFSEILQSVKKNNPVQIFATDIDLKALHKARTGVYPARALQNLPIELKRKYFTKITNENYEINKDLIKMVLFSRHDVTSNPPFLRLDLVSCRNLLIYFNLSLQKRVMPLFYYALNPNGYLVLGKSEDVGRFQNLYATIDMHHKIFQRKQTDGKAVKIPNLRFSQPKTVAPREYNNKHDDLTISEMVKETVYTGFEYPYVVLDDTMDIVEISGDISPYIQFKAGTATLNINKLIHPDLQIELRASLGKTVSHSKPVRGNIRKFTVSDNSKYVRLLLKPLLFTKPNNPHYLVIFEEIEFDEKFFSIGREVMEQKESPRVLELEQDLDATKEYTNSLLQELETSNEELQAMNEELQSSNEELQASNEELESSNEELQATNEELENAYTEIREANSHIEAQKEHLQRSEENLKALLNNTHVGFILIDKNFKILSYNAVAQNMHNILFSTPMKEGVSFIQVLPDAIFPTFLKHIKEAFDGEHVVSEQEIATKDGKKYHFQLNYSPVEREDVKNEIAYISLSFLDITPLRESQAAMHYQKSLLESQQQVSPLGTLVVSRDGKLLSYNSLFVKMWKFPKKVLDTEIDLEALKAAQEQLVDPEGFMQRVEYLYKHREQSREELHFKDGRVFERFGSPVIDEDKKDYGYVWFFLDVTEKKKLERQREEFIAIATHELKTPVTSIKGYAQVLQNRFMKAGDEPSARLIAKMDSQLNKLTTLIGDLLDVTKIETGKLQFHEDFFDFNELAKEIIEEMQRTTDKHTIVLKSEESKTLFGDRDRIGQVLTNLISNAIKYSPGTDKITVTTKVSKDSVTCAVKDGGIGLSKEDQSKIFERFYRVNGPAKRTYPGLGLGLYISSEVIRRHGGTIWAESDGKNKGSSFSFKLPLKAAAKSVK